MKEEVFKWIDAHSLTQEEAGDLEYLLSLIGNFEENQEDEFEEEEAIKLAMDYQIHFRKNPENID
jgi:hypothetical protein